MIWKKWENWFKGAIIGLVIALIISIGIGTNIKILNNLASPGVSSCQLLTSCSNCVSCNIIGLMFNLIYGFIIGAIIGWIIGKVFISEDKIIQTKKRKKR